MRKALIRALVVGLFALLAVGFGASPAQAHATLEGTDPPTGSIVDPAPTVITMNFSERVVPVKDRIKVIAPDGSDVVQGEPSTVNGGARVRIPLKSGLKDGTYLVSYRFISADGHPVSGGYTFSSRVPSALGAKASEVNTGTASASVNAGVRGVQSVSRYAAYAGIVLLAGPLVIVLGLWPRRLATAGPRRLAWTGWGLLAVGTIGVLVLQQPYADGGTLADISVSGVGEALDETVGRALLIRLALLLAVVPVLLRVLRPPAPTSGETPGWAGPVDRVLAAILGVAVLITFPYAGHAGQSPAPLISVPAITLHVGAMAVWLGGLAVLARYLLPRAKYRELEVILPVWSRWAFWAVAALVFSGVIETFLEIGGFGGLNRLLDTTYGQLVLTKIIWLGAILVVAANARAWIRRRFGVPVAYALAAEEPKKVATKKKPAAKKPEAETADFSASGRAADEVRRLRSRIAIEVLLGAVVLALATALVQVAPARSADDAAEAAANLPYSAQVEMGPNVLQIDLSPARIGRNELHLTLFDQNGLPVKVEEWSGSADLAKANVSTDVVALPLTENHAVGQVELPIAGEWKFVFTARTSDIDQYSVTKTITIR